MTAEWERYCHSRDLELEGKTVRVTLPGGSVHRVSVADEPDAYRLTAIVVRASVASEIENLPVQTWNRNRGTELVGFKIDAKS